jgi:hypothetical protein
MEETKGLPYVMSQISYARWTYGSLVLHNTFRLSKCELSAVLPTLYNRGHISTESSGFVTDADYEALLVDIRNELGSLIGLAFGALCLAGILLWAEGVYGEGREELEYRYKGARRYTIKRVNEFTLKHFGKAYLHNEPRSVKGRNGEREEVAAEGSWISMPVSLASIRSSSFHMPDFTNLTTTTTTTTTTEEKGEKEDPGEKKV